MIRHAQQQDFAWIQAIYAHARQVMAQNGNPTQWGTTNPTAETIQTDLDQRQCYLVERNGAICGVFAFIIGDDPTYHIIENGQWLNDKLYGTIHRVASAGTAKGILSEVLCFCQAQIDNLRIDTHSNNTIMQHQLEKHGFQRCGIIYVRDGSPRIAYQLTTSSDSLSP